MCLHRRLIVASALLAAVSAVLSNADNCGEWSVWETRPWGGARRREGCADGRIEEQCRSDSGVVIRCRMASDTASAPHLDTRRSGLKNYAYYYYYYSYSGTVAPSYAVTYSYYSYYSYLYYSYYYDSYSFLPCSIGCLIGIGIGALTGFGFLVAGTIVVFCYFCKGNRRMVTPVRPGVVTATVVSGGTVMTGGTSVMTGGTSVMTGPAYGGVTVYPSANVAAFNNQGFSGEQQQYGSYPHATYPPTAYPPTAYPPPYPEAYPTTYPSTYPEMPVPEPALPSSSGYPGASQAASTGNPPPYAAK